MLNRAEVVALRQAGGRVVGAEVRVDGAEVSVDSRLVVNAAGPWVDRVRRLEDPRAGTSVRLSRGAHVLVPGGTDWHAALHERRPVRAMLVQRQEKLDPPHLVRRDDLRQHAPLVMRLAYKANVAESQVAEPAVDELRRRARGSAREIPGLDERDREPEPGGVGGDGGADDPSSDDEQVEAPGRKLLDRSRAGVHPWIVPQL